MLEVEKQPTATLLPADKVIAQCGYARAGASEGEGERGRCRLSQATMQRSTRSWQRM